VRHLSFLVTLAIGLHEQRVPSPLDHFDKHELSSEEHADSAQLMHADVAIPPEQAPAHVPVSLAWTQTSKSSSANATLGAAWVIQPQTQLWLPAQVVASQVIELLHVPPPVGPPPTPPQMST